jgi:hypothetical protein
LCGVNLDVQIGEDDDVQLVLTAMALMTKEKKELKDSAWTTPKKDRKGKKKDKDDESSDSDDEKRDKKLKVRFFAASLRLPPV